MTQESQLLQSARFSSQNRSGNASFRKPGMRLNIVVAQPRAQNTQTESLANSCFACHDFHTETRFHIRAHKRTEIMTSNLTAESPSRGCDKSSALVRHGRVEPLCAHIRAAMSRFKEKNAVSTSSLRREREVACFSQLMTVLLVPKAS